MSSLCDQFRIDENNLARRRALVGLTEDDRQLLLGYADWAARIAPGVGLAQLQIRRQRQRGGALHAHAHATCQGCGIGMLHPVLGDQHGRPRIGRCAGPPGFQRQRRQVQGHPQHGERRAGPAR